ncbi:hypothetical protein BY996DRAFT_6602092 [Phakopsora pachyrhizi]|nr:hypothetical protein BY996DRAFT_6602092 [Phakopsora pachyrhizi]
MNCGDQAVIMMEEYSAFSESAGSRTRYPPAMRTLPGHDTIVEFIEVYDRLMLKIVNPVLHNLVSNSSNSSGGHHSAGHQKFFLVIGLRQRMITFYYQRQTSVRKVNFPSNHPLSQVERIDAITDEVQKMNQVASKIGLVVMSKMDGKPDDVHDEEYHTMIKGMLSDKEFRKTLPEGLYGQQYLARKSQHRYIVSTFYPFPKAKQPRTGSLPGSDLVPLQTNDLTLVSYNTLRWTIDACNYDGTSLGLNIVNPSTNHSQKLRLKQWAVVLIDDQLAKQLGVTTRTDDRISRPSVTPIKDSIGHHPPKEFSTYVKSLTPVSTLTLSEMDSTDYSIILWCHSILGYPQCYSLDPMWSAQDKAQSILKHLDKRPNLTRPLKALEHRSLSEPYQT